MKRLVSQGLTLPVVAAMALSLMLLLFVAFEFGQYSSTVVRLAKETSRFDVPSKNAEPGNVESNTKEWIETVSWSPRIFVYHNFLTKAECDYIVNMSLSKITRSEVVGRDGNPIVDSARTSSGYFIMGQDAMDPLIRKIERKIALWTHIPVENGEAFYVLRYQRGQRYVPHMDAFDQSNKAEAQAQIGPAGNRIATVLTCLRSPDKGGETEFPRINLKVPCVTGNAILFWDAIPSVKIDDMSLHGGMEVTEGTKWAMTKWLRMRKFWDYPPDS